MFLYSMEITISCSPKQLAHICHSELDVSYDILKLLCIFNICIHMICIFVIHKHIYVYTYICMHTCSLFVIAWDHTNDSWLKLNQGILIINGKSYNFLRPSKNCQHIKIFPTTSNKWTMHQKIAQHFLFPSQILSIYHFSYM